jgi:hypothetical protein
MEVHVKSQSIIFKVPNFHPKVEHRHSFFSTMLVVCPIKIINFYWQFFGNTSHDHIMTISLKIKYSIETMILTSFHCIMATESDQHFDND